jgi:hypothetical protein
LRSILYKNSTDESGYDVESDEEHPNNSQLCNSQLVAKNSMACELLSYSIVSSKEKFEENKESKEIVEIELKETHKIKLKEINFEDKIIGML